jgi:hypothetical protein
MWLQSSELTRSSREANAYSSFTFGSDVRLHGGQDRIDRASRIRVKHYSIRTEQAYCDWIRRFIIFHGKRHPSGLGAEDVETFLTSLAVQGRVAASTQNQARSALLFLYREELGSELPRLAGIQKAKAPARLPYVFPAGARSVDP